MAKFTADGSALSYCTYVGGTLGAEDARSIAVDESGYAYITGQTSAEHFPTTDNALQKQRMGASDAYVTKLSADGTSLEYSTLLGASGNATRTLGFGIALDATKHAYVTGYVSGYGGFDFPTTSQAFSTSVPSTYPSYTINAYLTKLSIDGSSLEYSTYLGPGQGNFVAVDKANTAYVGGYAYGPDFPVTEGETGVGIFVSKVSSDGAHLVSSSCPLNGARYAYAGGFALDHDGDILTAGQFYPFNSSFPTTLGAYQTEFAGGGSDAFVFKLSVPSVHLAFSEPSLQAGSAISLPWSSIDVDAVDIDLSSDAGANWATIAEDLDASEGNFDWTIPTSLPSGSDYLIRISDPSRPGLYDISESFTIISAPVITSHPTSSTVCSGETVTLGVSATGANLVYQWQKDGANISGASSSTYHIYSAITAANGSYACVVTNGGGTSVTSNSATVTVRALPTISVSVSPSSIWPPNRSMTQISASVSASGACTPVSVQLVEITSNESLGSGDIQDATTGSADYAFKLRADRNSSGTGRVYTIKYKVTDAANNVQYATATVTVPHDQGHKPGVTLAEPSMLSVSAKPNPLNAETVLSLTVPSSGHASLGIYDALGRLVATLFEGELQSGVRNFTWDATRESTGLYYYRLQMGKDVLSGAVEVAR